MKTKNTPQAQALTAVYRLLLERGRERLAGLKKAGK